MASGVSLLQLIERLLSDPAAAEAFGDSPDGYLAEHGLGHLSAADVHDALSLGWDSVPPGVAARLDLPADATDSPTAGDALASFVTEGPSIDLEPAGDEADLGFGLGQLDGDSVLEHAEDPFVDGDVPADVSAFETVDFGGEFGAGDAGDPLTDAGEPDVDDQLFDDGDDLL